MIVGSVFPLLSATVPSSLEQRRTGTTTEGGVLVPRTSSRRAILPTRPRGRKRRNSSDPETPLRQRPSTGSGSAYVFEKSDSSDATSWTQVAKLTAKDGAMYDCWFGFSVAISDGTIVVGAKKDGDNDRGWSSGSAYVFEKSDSSDATSWTEVKKLLADDPAQMDYFGCSVAISDGTIVVGAYADDDKGSGSGSAYVFEMSDSSDATSWTQKAKLTAKDGAASDYFGHSVAISDGTIVVGAHLDDDEGSNSGSAYVFEKSDSSDATSWTQTAKLTAKDGAMYDCWFGFSVAISDGTIVVGAKKDGDNDRGWSSGSAYVFEKSDSSDATSWTEAAKLLANDPAQMDYFGCSVAISDGTIVVGAKKDGDNDRGWSSGSAYVFEKSDSSDATSWTEAAKLLANDPAQMDYFGCSVAISDGTIVVGAYADDDKGSGSGSAYVFEKSDSSDATSWTQVAKLTAKDGAMYDCWFGFSVAISDGTIVVGAKKDGDNDRGWSSGSAYVFEKSDSSDATSWTEVKKLLADDPAQMDYFGCSVAISDGTIVVGAYADDDKGSGSGSAYVFEMSDSSDATSWTQKAKLTAKDGAASDYFGHSVAISDGTIVVGAHLDDDEGSNSGSAYVFEKSDSSDATSWTQTAKLTAKDGAMYDCWFGYSVAISDGTMPSSEHRRTGTTIKGQLLVPRTSSR